MIGEQEEIIADVLAAYRLGPALEVHTLGGTAARKWSVVTPAGRFAIRIRPDEFADAASTGFDHAVLRRLAAAGLPVPCPESRPGGDTFLSLGGHTIEVLSWIEGPPGRSGAFWLASTA